MISRRVLMSVISIFTVIGLVTTTTYALFSAQATNTGNTFGAGTLTLDVTPGVTPAPGPGFTVSGAAPGQSFDQLFNLNNTGTVAASAVKIAGIAREGANPNLADKLTLTLFDDANSNGTYDVGETLLGSAHLSDPVWNGYTIPGAAIPAGGTYKLGARITFDSDTDNSYQGLSMSFNITFQANQ